MAITMNLYYTGTNGSARRFAEEMISTGTVDAIRAEPGSLRYEYFTPFHAPETVLLIDSWVDQAAIDAHHASPMMQTITDLRAKYDCICGPSAMSRMKPGRNPPCVRWNCSASAR